MHQLLEMHAARHRDRAQQELAFLRAIRCAVPAALDNKAAADYAKREATLIKQISA